MTATTREQIAAALFTLVSDAAGLAGVPSRRLKLWGEVPLSQRPALYMREPKETYVRKSEAVPPIRTLHVELFIYTDSKDRNVVGASLINNVLDAIDAALAPSPVTAVNTLGGLVAHAWVEGAVFKDAGDLDGDGLTIVTINVLWP